MKIKSIVALVAVVASCFQAGASVAQIPALPLMGGLDGGGIPSLEGIVNVAALPGVIPGLLEDVPRTLSATVRANVVAPAACQNKPP